MEQNQRIPRQEYPAQPPMNPVHPPANPQPMPQNPPAAYPSPAYSLATVAVAEQLAQWQAGVDLSGMDYSADCFLEGKKDEWENELQ